MPANVLMSRTMTLTTSLPTMLVWASMDAFGGTTLGSRVCSGDHGTGAEVDEVNSSGKSNAARGAGDEDILALGGTRWWEWLEGEFVGEDELREAKHLEVESGGALELRMVFG